MSVKLIYGVDTKTTCLVAERLGGFCYTRLNPTGKVYGDKIRTDSAKVLIDLAKYAPLSELSKENPIEIDLDYGIVPVESKNVRDITVYNSKDSRAPMSQEFTVEPKEELMEQYDNVFHTLLLEKLDYLPLINPQFQNKNNNADTQFKFRVLFKPKLSAIAYTSTLFVWVGKVPIRLRCHGFSEGPYVTFSQNVLNFGGQYYGSESRIRIDMMNHSIAEAHFQFDTDNFRCPFKICPIAGAIPPHTTLRLEVIFRPHKPQTYYKRVYCLLHQQNPQYLDLIGVCVPRPFFMENPIDFCVSAADTYFLPLPSPSFEEYFQHDVWGIKLSDDNFNFGGIDLKSLSTSSQEQNPEIQNVKSLILTSYLPYDVLLEWVPDPTQIFHVTPATAFLNAHQMLQFEVHFTPQLPDTFFSGQLECYIYPTTLIWAPREGPPWIYIPKLAKLKAAKKAPPLSGVSEASYRSVSVEATEEDIANSSTSPTTQTTVIRTATTPLPATTTTVPTTGSDRPGSSIEDTTPLPPPVTEDKSESGKTTAGSDAEHKETGRGDGSVTSRDTPRSKGKKSKGEKADKSGRGKKSSRPGSGGLGGKKGKKGKDDTKTSVVSETAEEEEEEPYVIITSKPTVPEEPKIFGKIPFIVTIKNGENTTEHKITALKHYQLEPIDPIYDIQLDPRCIGTAISPRFFSAFDTEEEEGEEEEDVAATTDVATISDEPHEKKGKKSKKKSKKGKKESETDKEEGSSKGEDVRPSFQSSEEGKESELSGKTPESDGTNRSTKSKKSDKSRKSTSTDKSSKKGRKGSKKRSKTADEEAPPVATAETEAEGEDEGFDEKFFNEFPQAYDEFEGSEGENWDALGCGDVPQLQKRTGSFHIPERSAGGDGDTAAGPSELALPLCLTLRVAGHTYSANSQPPIPQANLPSKVTMNPCLPQHREFRTIIVKNTSDLPLLYQINDIGRTEIYSAKPLVGVIPGEGKQIVMISMDTKSPETAAYTETCMINLNMSDDNPVSIYGYAEVPTLLLTILSDAGGSVNEIVCATTIPGYSTNAKITMQNPSRFHYRYTIEFNHEDERLRPIFTPTPTEGIIAPYNTATVTWKFVPYDFQLYTVPWKFRFEVMGAKTEDSIWNAVYECTIPLQGEGSECSLTVEPKVLDFDFVEIFDTAIGYFTVTNKGTSVVTANLIVRHEQWLQWYNKEQVSLTPSTISLKAGEQIAIETAVRPDKPIMYKFYVEYELERDERNAQAEYVPEGKPFALLWIQFLGNHSVAKVADVQQLAAHPCWDTDQCWAMFSASELNRLLQPLQNTVREGKLPKIPSVSFRFPGAIVGSQPAIFAVSLGNMGGVDQHWQIYTQPPKNNKLYQLQQANQPETFSGHSDLLESPGFLTALWLDKYKQMYKALRQKPVDESLTMAALKNSENFRISPTRGVNPGAQVINFRFQYNMEGIFRMPVLLRIYPAIFVWIDLEGVCLGPMQPGFQLMYPKEMVFHPISLNDIDPPIQTLWVYNGGALSAQFRVELDTFKRIRGRNFGHSCFECLTPEGVALPKTWTAIKLRFSPLEYKSYESTVRILYEEYMEEIKLYGSPTMSDELHLRPLAQPHQTEIVDPFVPVTLSPSRVVFPHFIPTGDKATSVIFITNLSAQHSMSFAWPEVTYVNSTSIKFLPDIGILAPKEQCACQVIVAAGGVNQILRTSVRCWIEDVTAINEYDRQEKIWTEWETAEQKEVPVVTRRRGPQKAKAQQSPVRPIKPKSCSRLLSISCYIGSSFGTLDNIWNKELSKMPITDPVGVQPLPEEIYGKPLYFSNFNKHLSKDILRQVLWDIVMLSPNWPSYIRQITKRESIYYDDYKGSENSKEVLDEMKPLYRLPQKTKEDIVEFVMFTMLQEMADHYVSGDQDWAALKPGAFT